MAGEHGKNREIDFAYWANLGDKDDLSDEETVRLPQMLDPRRLQTGMNESDALDVALIQCENLYRVAALLAYGNGLAGYCDVERFTLVEGVSPNGATTPNHSDGYDESELLTVTVTMPYAWGYDEGRIPERLETSRAYRSVLNPDKPVLLSIEYSAYMSKGYQEYKALTYPDIATAQRKYEQASPETCKRIGQLIVNAQTLNNYLGVYDGKPLFESRCGFDALWQAMAELTDKQAPGICPVCGKVVDRRRDEKGGHPKKTCAAHSDKFHNMKKKLQRSGDKAMLFSDKCEEAVRQQRWHDASLNERPLHSLASEASNGSPVVQ